MGALDGVKILGLSWASPGPLDVMLLAEQGADVVKVDCPYRSRASSSASSLLTSAT